MTTGLNWHDLDKMVEGGFASWAALPDQLDKSSMTHDENVLMMTYASEMFGWYAGREPTVESHQNAYS
jgi:hypothetical protein